MAQPVYRGTIIAINGFIAQVKFADGAQRGLPMDGAASVTLSMFIGQPIAFRMVSGSMQVAQDAKWSTLASVNGGKAVVRNAPNQTATYAVDAATQQRLQASGKLIAYTVSGNTLLAASDRAPPG